MTFLEGHKVLLHHSAEAAAQTTITPSSGVDIAGFRTVAFAVLLGDVGSGGVPAVKVQQSSDDGDQDAYSDLEGSLVSAADDDDDSVVVIEVVNPTKRYLKCIVTRASGDTAIGGILAILGCSGVALPTQPANTLGGDQLFQPEEGTP